MRLNKSNNLQNKKNLQVQKILVGFKEKNKHYNNICIKQILLIIIYFFLLGFSIYYPILL